MGGALKRFFDNYAMTATANESIADKFGLYVISELHCKLPAKAALFAKWETDKKVDKLKIRRTHEITKYYFAYMTSDKEEFERRKVEAKIRLQSLGPSFEPRILFTDRSTKEVTDDVVGTSQYSAFWGGGPDMKGRLFMSRHACFCSKCRAGDYDSCAHEDFTGRKAAVELSVLSFTIDNFKIQSTATNGNSQTKQLYRADFKESTFILVLPNKKEANAEMRAVVYLVPGSAADFHVGLVAGVKGDSDEFYVVQYAGGQLMPQGGRGKVGMSVTWPVPVSEQVGAPMILVKRESVMFVSESTYDKAHIPAVLSLSKETVESLSAYARNRVLRVGGGDEVDEEEQAQIRAHVDEQVPEGVGLD